MPTVVDLPAAGEPSTPSFDSDSDAHSANLGILAPSEPDSHIERLAARATELTWVGLVRDPDPALVHLRRRETQQTYPDQRTRVRPAARLDLAGLVHPHRTGPNRPDDRRGMYTVAELADRGIAAMTDEQIRDVPVGRTVRSVNLVTGFEVTLYYGVDGNRLLMGLGDRPVVTSYEIRDGQRIETSLLGDRMSIALFSVDGRTLGARTDEAGYINYEAFTTN
jgi:hypothetical protein